MSAKTYSALAAFLFTLLAILQLARAAMRVEVLANGTMVPVVASWIAFAVLAILALLGFQAARN